MSPIQLAYVIAGMASLALPIVAAGDEFAHKGDSAHGRSNNQEPFIPSSIEAEHEKLHAHLARLLKSGGKTEFAAREVEKLLGPHFLKEEQFAMPPLGLLSMLASGAAPSDTESVTRMTDRLKAELPEMLREHKDITVALHGLRHAAQDEQKIDAMQFVDDLLAHAVQEEQILYPGAILVGEYLKRKR